MFIQKEAEVSRDDVSSDEQEDNDDDCYEGSFIDNNTVMMQTQSTGRFDVPIHFEQIPHSIELLNILVSNAEVKAKLSTLFTPSHLPGTPG